MFAVSLALLANAFPSPKERAGALAAYGATIGASFAIGPLVGGLLTSGLDWQWIFLDQHPDRHRLPRRSRARYVAGVARPARPRHRLGRPDHADRRPRPARARAPARQRGRLDEHPDRRRAGRRRRRARRVRARSRCASRSRCCRCACSATARSPARRSRRSRSPRRSSRSSSTSRSTCSRSSACRRSRPAWSTCPGTLVMLVVSGATAQLGAKVPARTMIAGRPRARRGRHGPVHARRRRRPRGWS